jgi:heme-degrading monooxygenase HmoA
MYSYVWEYQVHPDYRAEFESSYGSNGEWVNLFRRHPGYLRTELLRDQNNAWRFLTIDTWESRERYLSFREEFRIEFESIDKKCEAFTKSEQFLGEFDSQE